MDEVERQRFLETLRNDEEFRTAVRRELELEALRALPERVMHLTTGVSGLIQDQADLRRSMTTLIEVVGDLARTVDQAVRITSEGLGEVVQRLGSLEERVNLGFAATDRGFAATDRGFAATKAEFDQVHAAIAELRDERHS